MAAGLLGIVKMRITIIGICIWSIGGKFMTGIQINITSPVFVFLTCFLALSESLRVFTFMMVVNIRLLGLMDEQRPQRQHSTMEGLASELLKRVMYRVIEGIKEQWYSPRNEHQARNTHTEKNKRNKQKNSKQHK